MKRLLALLIPKDVSEAILLPKSEKFLLQDYFNFGYKSEDRAFYLEDRDKMTGEQIYQIREQRDTLYYDHNDVLLGRFPQMIDADVYGGRIRTIDGEACTYYDTDGSVIFRFPITRILDD